MCVCVFVWWYHLFVCAVVEGKGADSKKTWWWWWWKEGGWERGVKDGDIAKW